LECALLDPEIFSELERSNMVKEQLILEKDEEFRRLREQMNSI
jgi:hypothetical protein